MILYLLSVGFVSILAQVVVLRELNVAFFGVELIYILAIAGWLLSTAIGALVGSRARPATRSGVGRLFVAFSLLMPADVVFIRSLRAVSGGIPGTFLPFGVQLLGLAVVLAPMGVVLGLLFRRAATLYISDADPLTLGPTNGRAAHKPTRTLAGAYAIESAGGLLGGLVSTVFLALGLQNFAIAVFCSAAALVAVLATGAAASARDRTRQIAFAVLVLVIVLAAVSSRVDRSLTRINHPTLVASRDSPYGRITLTRQGGQFVVYENDAIAFETQSVAAEELVHVAAVNAPSLARILVLGGGIEGAAAEAGKYGAVRVDVVELNPVLVSLAKEHLPPAGWAMLTEGSMTLFTTDPRRFVKNTGARYDLILIGAPDPASGQANRFFTREFFEECERILSPGGVIALRLRSSENVWTPFLAHRNSSIVKALMEVFADVVVLPGVTNVVIGSGAPLSRDGALLGARLRDRGVATRLVTPEYIEYLYTNDRFGEIARRISDTRIASNTDARPVCYKYSSMMWLSKFFPGIITADVGSSDDPSGRGAVFFVVCAAGAAAAAVISRRRAGFQRVFLAGYAGFAGMVLETAMILHYQVRSGVLYQNLGILLTAFMAGLTLGAAAIPRVTRSRPEKLLSSKRICGTCLLGGFLVLALAFVGLLRAGYPTGLLAVSALLFFCGFLVAGVFAYASLLGLGGQKAMVGPLYAADLIGGCTGCVLGSLFLIPFLGMEQAAGLTLLVTLVALLAV